MIANRLLKTIFIDEERFDRLVRWSGKSSSLCYRWLRPSVESGAPSPLQRVLDLIDLVFLFDRAGARRIAQLPLDYYNSLVTSSAESSAQTDRFQNAFRGMKEAMEACNSLTDAACSPETREQQLTDVQVWLDENFAQLRQEKMSR